MAKAKEGFDIFRGRLGSFFGSSKSHFFVPFRIETLGNGRNTVSRVLFRRRELTEPEFWGKLGEFCTKLGEFALAHK